MKTYSYFSIILLALALAGCVQKEQPKTISVYLDMTDVENPGKVGIRGEYPLSWDDTIYLQDNDRDSIYTAEFEVFSASNQIKFKFVNQDSVYELQGQKDRILKFDYKSEAINITAKFNNRDAKILKN